MCTLNTLTFKMADKLETSFDQELRKAFAELQAKVIDTTQRVKIAEAQVDALKRTIMHAKLTDQEVGSLPSDTRTYEPLGRMFILEPAAAIRERLAEKISVNQEKITKIEANKEYLQKAVKEHEDNIREMLENRPR